MVVVVVVRQKKKWQKISMMIPRLAFGLAETATTTSPASAILVDCCFMLGTALVPGKAFCLELQVHPSALLALRFLEYFFIEMLLHLQLWIWPLLQAQHFAGA